MTQEKRVNFERSWINSQVPARRRPHNSSVRVADYIFLSLEGSKVYEIRGLMWS